MSLTWEEVRQERCQVLDIEWFGLKKFASIWCLKPHIGGSSCMKHAVVQVYNYTGTSQNKKVQPFHGFSYAKAEQESAGSQRTCFCWLPGAAGSGEPRVSPPPNTGCLHRLEVWGGEVGETALSVKWPQLLVGGRSAERVGGIFKNVFSLSNQNHTNQLSPSLTPPNSLCIYLTRWGPVSSVTCLAFLRSGYWRLGDAFLPSKLLRRLVLQPLGCPLRGHLLYWWLGKEENG